MAGHGSIDVHTMFPVPLAMTRIDGAEALNAALAGEVAARRKAEPGIERSNRYGWHSAPDLFERKEPAHRELAAAIADFIAATNAKVLPGLPAGLSMRMDGWVNCNPTNAMNAPHDHAGAFWSGTYYAAVPLPEDADDTYSGAIEFIDPRGSLGSNALIETPLTKPKFTVRPGAGTLLLWPAYVKHWVHPNRAAGDRMTVSFNAWFAKA